MSDYYTVIKEIIADAPYNKPVPFAAPYPDGEDYLIRYYEIGDTYIMKDGHRNFSENHKGRPITDLLIGFYAADGPAKLDFQISHPAIDLPIELDAGEFKFALYNKYTYPEIRTCYHQTTYANVVGKVYAVYAYLSQPVRRFLCCTYLYCVADLVFVQGMVGRVSNTLDEPLFISDMDEAKKYIKKHCPHK